MGFLFALIMLPIGALVYRSDQVALSYAELPLTDIADLTLAGTTKVYGIVESAWNPTIHWTGSSRSGHWVVHPFNVTDATGSIPIRVSLLDGEEGRRVIESGIHDREWWPGDPVSVVGEIRDDGTGKVSILARRVARTPTSFYRPDEGPAVMFLIGSLGAGIGAASLLVRYRIRRDHRIHAPLYPYRLTDWRVCVNCGDRVLPQEPHCPACGAASLREPVRDPALQRLPSLDIATRFSGMSTPERAVIVSVTAAFPVLLVALVILLAPVPERASLTPWLIFIGLAVALPAALGVTFLVRRRVLLGPDTIEERSSRGLVATREVDRAVTVRHGRRIVHFVFNRGGLFVTFGPGLRPPDLDAATQWVRTLALTLGIPHREASSLQEAVTAAHRDL